MYPLESLVTTWPTLGIQSYTQTKTSLSAVQWDAAVKTLSKQRNLKPMLRE